MTAFDYLFALEQFGIKFGLANMSAILRQLDRPELAFRSVHIAGTNGKGSVTAMTEAGLRAAGYRTARYTSPHLMSLNERFVIQGRAVTDEALVDAIETVRDAVETLRSNGTLDVQPTFFEVTTAVGFELFRRSAVEIAVVEVGLGGRLDATNVLMPEATAITSIALDHQLFLGSTLASIAREKAGIVKPGVPLVIGELDDKAEEVIAAIAGENGAPLIRTIAADVAKRHIGLAGAHQRANAAIAVRLLETLDRRGIPVSAAAIDHGLEQPEWPGRLDLRRVGDGRWVLMDAAHNPAGAEALARHLHEGVAPPAPLVFAAMRDKDVRGMFKSLLPAVCSLIVTRANHLRSADPADLADIAQDIAPTIDVTVERSIPQALESAWRRSRSGNIVVAGSIFLLGDVMKELGLH